MARPMIMRAFLTALFLTGNLSMTAPAFSQGAVSSNQEATKCAREAGNFLRQQNFAGAIPLLRQSCQFDDTFAAAHANLGLALMKVGQIDEAIKEMERSTQLDPALAAPWINLGPLYINQGNLAGAANAYQKYIDLVPDSPARQRAEQMLATIRKQLRSGGGSGATDYYDAAASQGILIWRRQRMPLKVFIASGERVPGYKENYGQILRAAFADWSQAMNNKIWFVETSDVRAADITCTWAHDSIGIDSPSEGGKEISDFSDRDGLQHAKIVILTTDPPGVKLNDLLMNWITHHEVGHALGINGHSTDAQDIMYFSATPFTKSANLTQRDVNTLAKLYAQY